MEVLTLFGICLVVSFALGGLWLMATDEPVGFGDFIALITFSVVLLWVLPLLFVIGIVFGVAKLIESAIGMLRCKMK